MENDTAEKTVKNDFHFVDSKTKIYCPANKGKIQRRIPRVLRKSFSR